MKSYFATLYSLYLLSGYCCADTSANTAATLTKVKIIRSSVEGFNEPKNWANWSGIDKFSLSEDPKVAGQKALKADFYFSVRNAGYWRITLSLTFLRSVGWIGREFFVTAAYKIPTPDAQCLGKHQLEYSLYPHEGTWEEAKAWQAAHGFNAPLETIEVPLHSGKLPIEFSLVSLEPEEMIARC